MFPMLKDKNILLGVTGSIAAFKAASVASKLTQLGAHVHVILTANAQKFIGTATFEGITHSKCYTDTFENADDLSQSHVTLGTQADLALIAPCSANLMAKLAHGIADDKLSTTLLAVRCPVIVAPAMNTHMYENAATQANVEILRRRGITVIEPGAGPLACGTTGRGRMPDPEDLVELCVRHLAMPKILENKRVLVTAGPTREPIDAVRFISNPSTGKMGYACARAALMAGAEVTLISGPTSLPPVQGAHLVRVTTAAEMTRAVLECAPQTDIVLMTAAVADFTPTHPSARKTHKERADHDIELSPTADILATLGAQKHQGQFLCGFCMETEDLLARATKKLHDKHLDMIVANDLSRPDAGFATDTNRVLILTHDATVSLGDDEDAPSKLDIAIHIIQTIAARM